MNTNTNTPIQHPHGLDNSARFRLVTVAFDLSPTDRGSPERVVSAWKLIPTCILNDRDHDDNEGFVLFEAVKEDLDEATALRDFVLFEAVKEDLDEATALRVFGSEEPEHHIEDYWFGAFIELADAYGAENWPEAALIDYLCGFEGMHELEARVVAALHWEKAKALYDAHKSDPTAKAAFTSEEVANEQR